MVDDGISQCVVWMFSLQSRYIGIVSISCEIMFGGVSIVVSMKMLMIVQLWFFLNCCGVIQFSSIRIIIVIGSLKLLLKVKKIVSMKFRQVFVFGVIVIMFGLKVVRKWNIVGSIRKQVKVQLVQNSSIEDISSGIVRCFLCVYSFGVMKVYSWYSSYGIVMNRVMKKVSFNGVKKVLVGLVVIIVCLLGSCEISGLVSVLYSFWVNGSSVSSIMFRFSNVCIRWLCSFIRCLISEFLLKFCLFMVGVLCVVVLEYWFQGVLLVLVLE